MSDSEDDRMIVFTDGSESSYEAISTQNKRHAIANNRGTKKQKLPEKSSKIKQEHSMGDFEIDKVKVRTQIADLDDDIEGMWIKSIHLQNFMCHENFSLEFNQNINFIVGQNGSGKSSVLCALILILGGKGNFTDRGNKQGNLVMDGKRQALIRLVIDNKIYPFEPENFGSEIIVERTIQSQKTGSTWKLLNSKGIKIYGERKRVLNMFEKHFNIVVGNPLNVLTQESAKTFLFSSTPKKKYEFFKKATRLSEIEEFYEKTEDQFRSASAFLKEKKSNLKILQKVVNEKKKILGRLKQVENINESIQKIGQALVWAFVIDEELKLKRTKDDLTKFNNELQKINDQAEDAKLEYNVISDKLDAINDQIETLTEKLDPNGLLKDSITQKIKENQRKHRDIRQKKEKIEEILQKEARMLLRYEKQLEKENEEFTSTQKSKVHDHQIKLKELEIQKEQILSKKSEAGKKCEKFSRNMMFQVENSLKEEKNNFLALEKTYSDCEKDLRSLRSAEKNRIHALGGESMERLISLVNRSEWKIKPIGPIGLSVHLKSNFRQFQRVLDTLLSQSMTDFIVFDPTDQQKLQKMILSCNFRALVPSINYRGRDLFDYTNGLPDSKYTNVLSILQIEDEYVKRLLIDSLRIEGILLFESRSAAEAAISNGYPRNVCRVCYKVDQTNNKISGYEIGTTKGGRQSKYLNAIRSASPFAATQQEAIALLQNQMSDLSTERRVLERKLKDKENELLKFTETSKIFKREFESIEEKERSILTNINSIKKAIQRDAPQTNENLMNTIGECRTQISAYKSQIAEYEEYCQERDEAILSLREEQERLAGNVGEGEHELRILESHKSKLSSEKAQSKGDYARYRAIQNKTEEQIRNAEQNIEKISQDLKIKSSNALTISERVESEFSSSELQSQLEIVQKEREEYQNRENVSYEVAATEYNNNLKEYLDSKESVANYVRLVSVIRTGLDLRKQKLAHHLDQVTSTTKQAFTHLLLKRQYTGVLEIDHRDEKLDIKVAVEADQITALSKKRKLESRSVKSLSGGEKSFASVCFLCSLWKHVPSPIRCLDEYLRLM
eukprot:NODE_198_length_13236_cov_1.328385.p1 type:complete len:1073 gc:universal NODE_198_length_13236_cov_1.328385:3782-564(-)